MDLAMTRDPQAIGEQLAPPRQLEHEQIRIGEPLHRPEIATSPGVDDLDRFGVGLPDPEHESRPLVTAMQPEVAEWHRTQGTRQFLKDLNAFFACHCCRSSLLQTVLTPDQPIGEIPQMFSA